MYRLYYSEGTCAQGILAVLNELEQAVEVINRNQAEDFLAINPVGAVPVLQDGDLLLTEGAAILQHLFEKHSHAPLAAQYVKGGNAARSLALSDLLFANATMHPAYSCLFFLGNAGAGDEGLVSPPLLQRAADKISALWAVVEQRLQTQPYLGGVSPGAADFMLAVYESWGQFFPVSIAVGESTQRMIQAIRERASVKAALDHQSIYAPILSVIQDYCDGLYEGNTEKLKRVCDSGLILKAPNLNRDLDTWLANVQARDIPKQTGEPYGFKVLSVDVVDDMAMVKLDCPLLGHAYVDFLGLQRLNNHWKIVNKMYVDKREPIRN